MTKPPAFIDSPRDIGARLRTLRKKKNMTGRTLSALTGTSAAYLSQVENGHRPLTVHLAAKFADALEASISDFGPTSASVAALEPSESSYASTSSGVAVFQYQTNDVRTVDLHGKRWAVAADICAVLELDQVSRAVSRLEKDDVAIISRSEGVTSNTPFWKQVDPRVNELTLVSEDGATDLVLDSRKPEARTFRRWLTHTVFPAIRDTGRYVHKEVDSLDVLRDTIDQLIAVKRTSDEALAIAVTTQNRLDAAEGRHGWFSALGYTKNRGLDPSMNNIQRLGQHAASIGRENGIEPGKTEHAHFGTVNSFPEWVWDEAVVRANL